MLKVAPGNPVRGLVLQASRRARHQLLFVGVTAVCLPGLVAALLLEQPLLAGSQASISLAASGLAALLAMLVYRQTCDFPGIRQTENVIPALALTYGLVFAVLLAFRIEYSRIILFSGFAFVLLGVFLVLVRQQRGFSGAFWLVPFGTIERVRRIEAIEWHDLPLPEVPPLAQRGIVVDLRAELPDAWERMIAQAVLRGIPVYHVKQLEEAITGRVDIEHLSENTLGALGTGQTWASLKRLGDVALSLLLLPLLVPLFGVLALLIRMDSPGPVFFRQERVGYRGARFRVIKFRTMAHRPGPLTGDDARAWAITGTDDMRITRIGRFLRRTRLDELPQVVNVLAGEMSWIGPRPEALELSAWYADHLPFYSYRHIVRPGITGWAQVSQGHVADLASVHDKLRFDFFYIKNFSLWLDLVIAARTVRVVLSGFGAK